MIMGKFGTDFDVSSQGSIKKIMLNGQNKTDFLPQGILGAPYSIAIDWLSRNIFIGNIGASTIEVVRLDGEENYRKVLLANNGTELGVAQPVALAVDPVKG